MPKKEKAVEALFCIWILLIMALYTRSFLFSKLTFKFPVSVLHPLVHSFTITNDLNTEWTRNHVTRTLILHT